jgi:hypothetical protein
MVKTTPAIEAILLLAFDRGWHGRTFATAEEYNTPGYDAAYKRGQLARKENEKYRYGGPNYDRWSTPDGV